MGLLKIGLIIVFKIQILKQWSITTREKVCYDKKMRTLSKKIPQIYLSIAGVDTKAKLCKLWKSKTQKFTQWHMSYIFTQ